MKAEIITIGDEILIGQVTDSNSGWIGRNLIKIGIQIGRITTVSDEKKEILDCLNDASARANLILVTGGLGPTKDDITKQTICEFFETKLIVNGKILEHVKSLFASRNLKMPEINIKQAEIPEKCKPITNNFGTAPGMWFEKQINIPAVEKKTNFDLATKNQKQIFIFMPGVPYEMEAMMENEIIPRLKTIFDTPYIVQKTILTQGIGESMLMEMIAQWEEDLYKKEMKLAYLPSFGTVRLRITLTGKNLIDTEQKVQLKIEELKKIIPKYFAGTEGEKPEEIIGKLLSERKLTLSIAESCTGGYLSHLITSIPGSSQYFLGSVISYSNNIKTLELGVSEIALQNNGAVSKEVVELMAMGLKDKFKTDYAIAISGIAGPSGGTIEKPVGTVWIAVAGPERVFSRVYLFGKSREKNIRQSSAMAINLLRGEIFKGA